MPNFVVLCLNKGAIRCLQSVQVLEMHVIFLGPKKITCFIADVRTCVINNAAWVTSWKNDLRLYQASTRNASIMGGKTYLLGVTCNDALACHLLTEVTETSNKLTTTRNATETNHASFSCSDVMTEGLCISETIVKWVLYYSWCHIKTLLQHAMFSSPASVFYYFNTYKDARYVRCTLVSVYIVAVLLYNSIII